MDRSASGSTNSPVPKSKRPRLSALRKQKQAELDQARTELENIKSAIRQGVVTATTREMLDEAEARVATLEASIRTQSKPKVVSLSSAVTRHLTDLKATLGRDNDRARKALSKLVSQVVLRRHGDLDGRGARQPQSLTGLG